MKQDKMQQPAKSSAMHWEVPAWAWLVVIAYMVFADNLFPSEYEGWALVAGWFAAATLCLVNYNSCGRYHCKITGPGFLVLGALAVLETLGIVSVPGWVTFAVLFAVLGVGFGLESRYRSECGTCYITPNQQKIRQANIEDK